MLGSHSGFAAFLKESPSLKTTHCFLHQNALAAKTLSLKLKKALKICVKVVKMLVAVNRRLL